MQALMISSILSERVSVKASEEVTNALWSKALSDPGGERVQSIRGLLEVRGLPRGAKGKKQQAGASKRSSFSLSLSRWSRSFRPLAAFRSLENR
ncbi:hypothetical protein V6N13_034971 [Hibiscus sabdariffa]|uniref:Uncharacterized protein n=1 Tax=Hibiscus sabdariffa TaxID=183260 RepID=A0ABR2AGF8_9ROSI